MAGHFTDAIRWKWQLAQRVLAGEFHFDGATASGGQPSGILAVVKNEGDRTRLVGRPLILGKCFYWDAKLCPVLEEIAPSIPDWTLTEPGIPSPEGFIWFAQCLNLPAAPDGFIYPLRALSWCQVLLKDDPSETSMRWADESFDPSEVDAVWFVITVYVDFEGEPHPLTVLSWEVGETLSGLLPKRPGGYSGAFAQAKNVSVAIGQYIASIFSFLEQEIVVKSDVSIPRPLRRNAPPIAKVFDPIKVIELRRRSRSQDIAEGNRDIEWSCQWVVRGHWRKQWYPAQQAHKPKYILPYVKGPDDKPLRVTAETVFNVVR